MRYSSDTGEPILNEWEEEAAWAAEEELDQIIKCKQEFEGALINAKRRFPHLNIQEMLGLVQEAFDDCFTKEWETQWDITRSLGYSETIPPFGALNSETPNQKANREYAKQQAVNREVAENNRSAGYRSAYAANGACRVNEYEEVDLISAVRGKQ